MMLVNLRKILFLAFILFCGAGHPFYLSVTDLKYNGAERSLQGSVKMFANDLEDALARLNKANVDLLNAEDRGKNNILLKEYLGSRLRISVNDKKMVYEFLGFEREEESIWIFIEVKSCPEPGRIDIENSLLFDFLKDQSNIIRVENNGMEKSIRLINPDKVATFEF